MSRRRLLNQATQAPQAPESPSVEEVEAEEISEDDGSVGEQATATQVETTAKKRAPRKTRKKT